MKSIRRGLSLRSASSTKKTSRGVHRVSLPRALSKLGFSSRKQAEELIRNGEVTVNGRQERNPHRWLNLETDRIEIAGVSVHSTSPRTIMLNKPLDVVTTRSDERGRRTVYALLGTKATGLIPVGRLDQDSTGLLLLTTDHRLADALTSPSAGVEKTYQVGLDRPLKEVHRRTLTRGVEIRIAGEIYRTKPAKVLLLLPPTSVEVRITEGRNRQIRKMFEAIGYEVRSLHRIALGDLALGDMREGEFRELSREEIAALKNRARALSQ